RRGGHTPSRLTCRPRLSADRASSGERVRDRVGYFGPGPPRGAPHQVVEAWHGQDPLLAPPDVDGCQTGGDDADVGKTHGLLFRRGLVDGDHVEPRLLYHRHAEP